MKQVFAFYENKLVESGLVDPDGPLLGFLDARLEWNRPDPAIASLASLFDHLCINSLLFAKPAQPYADIIDYLARTEGDLIKPRDCETRTFLHDLPIAQRPHTADILPLLKRRKGVIVPGYGLITYGSVSIEQAYVTFSSICFACFVKFFSDTLAAARLGRIDSGRQAVLTQSVGCLPPFPTEPTRLMEGPFQTENEVRAAMVEAGRAVVKHRLVDSYFGNISCLQANTLFISQTGSSLDRLGECIDPCPLDGSSCAGLTASSELSAHLGIIAETGCATILHGHPPFAVILSMDCTIQDCAGRDTCHIVCSRTRFACGAPIVPGEVGNGPHGLCNTVPPAIRGQNSVIVYGHGVFTIGRTDFNRPFRHLLATESNCRQEYFQRLREAAPTVLPNP